MSDPLDPSENVEETPQESQSLLERIGSTFNVLQESKRGETLVTSPLSLFGVFAMVSEGVSGKTAEEIKKVFGFGTDSDIDEKLAQAMKDIVSGANEDIILKMDNCLFTNKNIKIKPDYAEAIKEKYGAHAESLDFTKQETVEKINNRVKDNTDGLVEKALSKLSPASFCVLINTIYFKGDWLEPFSEEATVPGTFYKSDDTEIETDFMVNNFAKVTTHQNGNYSYLSLSYKSERTKFVIEMANDKQLTTSSSDDVLEVAKSEEAKSIKIMVPKFKAFFNIDLIPVLKGMGLHKAFSASKEFSKISSHQMCINSIIQNACISVDEEGTVASMFTFAAMDFETACDDQEQEVFYADKPFFFHIVDTQTDMIIFSGCQEEPRY